MEQSEEARGFLSSLTETFGTPRMGPAFTDAISAEPGVLMVGTDPAEWWDNPDDLLRAMQVQSAELQGAAATVSHSEGWIEGGIPDGSAAMLRITATLARRSGGWKIMQMHASVGAANEEIVGKELTI
jgi:hypothetical protein